MIPASAPSPVVVGGVGGSGTRVVGDLLGGLGFYMGLVRPGTRDNLWFAALFFMATELLERGADAAEIQRRLDLFDRVTAGDFAGPCARLASRLACLAYAGARSKLLRHGRLTRSRLLHELSRPASWARRDPRRYRGWGFKEPVSHIFLPHLAERYPRMRFVWVIRDPGVMARSPNRAQLRVWGARFGVEGDGEQAALEFWLRANREGLAAAAGLLGARCFVLRYEDLCEAPRDTVGALAGYLGARPGARRIEELSGWIRPASERLGELTAGAGAAGAWYAGLRTGPLR